jgi:hypothetical protein
MAIGAAGLLAGALMTGCSASHANLAAPATIPVPDTTGASSTVVAGGLPTTSTILAPTTTAPPTSAVTTTTANLIAPAVVGTTVLADVTCPTIFGIPQPETAATPPVIRSNVPPSLAPRLAAYTDQGGIFTVIAPAGWRCAANYGADGSGELVVVPPGEANSPFPAPFTTDARMGVAAVETSACRGCLYDLICPLLPDPVDAASYGACGRAKPVEEQVVLPSSSTAFFEDPAGIVGDGAPSGGSSPANGVMIHHPPEPSPGAETGLEETCTLPSLSHADCTAILNDFLVRFANGL